MHTAIDFPLEKMSEGADVSPGVQQGRVQRGKAGDMRGREGSFVEDWLGKKDHFGERKGKSWERSLQLREQAKRQGAWSY